jgi:hypothetical protein
MGCCEAGSFDNCGRRISRFGVDEVADHSTLKVRDALPLIVPNSEVEPVPIDGHSLQVLHQSRGRILRFTGSGSN